MADNNDTSFQRSNANFELKDLDGTVPASAMFNDRVLTQEGYENASEDAQRKIREQFELREQRLETLDKNHERFHDQNIIEEKNKLYEKQFSQPHAMPNTQEARELVQQTIEEQAEKNVDRRFEWNKQNTARHFDHNMREIMRRDQQAQRGAQDYDRERER